MAHEDKTLPRNGAHGEFATDRDEGPQVSGSKTPSSSPECDKNNCIDMLMGTLELAMEQIRQLNNEVATLKGQLNKGELAGPVEESDLISTGRDDSDETALQSPHTEEVEPHLQASHSSFDETVFGMSSDPSSDWADPERESGTSSEQREGILITLDELENDGPGTMLLVQHWWLMGDADFFCVTTSQRVTCPSH
ncbi:hypothetical protein ACRALDRAFT_1067952 [Sodiomyces alcalophilus JCM 7366]|uniref:uncharacterized protein n=1 Tax=Sodiomyces alcalophilus JCM 7366 TaxID=591952 RepID=UPI0039B375B3